MSPDGVFSWSVTGVDSGQPGRESCHRLAVRDRSLSIEFNVGVDYAGAKLQANVTSLSMVWYWSMQSFEYNVCANATVPRINGIDKNGTQTISKDSAGNEMQTVISMCSHFDLEATVPLVWATQQANISNSFYDLSAYFQSQVFPFFLLAMRN
jgi:hypothetical protein